MTDERDELPEGFDIFTSITGESYLSFPNGKMIKCRTEAKAIAAAWRIVDAEREAGDGKQ